MRASTTSTVMRMSWRVCWSDTERRSSRGAAPKTSAAIHGVDLGSSNQEMKEVMPAWATNPTAERRPGGMSPYQGSVSSSRFRVAVDSSPEMTRSQLRVCSFVFGVTATGVSFRRQRILLCPNSHRGGCIWRLLAPGCPHQSRHEPPVIRAREQPSTVRQS